MAAITVEEYKDKGINSFTAHRFSEVKKFVFDNPDIFRYSIVEKDWIRLSYWVNEPEVPAEFLHTEFKPIGRGVNRGTKITKILGVANES